MTPEHPEFSIEIRIVGHHRPSLPGGYGFDRVETKDGHISEGADPAAFVGGAKRMACILNKPKIILPGNLPDLIDRTRLPRVINVDYRAGFRADPPPYLIRVDIPRYRVDISKDRKMTIIEDSITCGGKGEGGCNDLTPFREVKGLDWDIQSTRAAVHRDRVPCADVSGKIRLKQIDGRPRREPVALQNLYDRSDIIIIDGLMPIRNELHQPYHIVGILLETYHRDQPVSVKPCRIVLARVAEPFGQGFSFMPIVLLPEP